MAEFVEDVTVTILSNGTFAWLAGGQRIYSYIEFSDTDAYRVKEVLKDKTTILMDIEYGIYAISLNCHTVDSV